MGTLPPGERQSEPAKATGPLEAGESAESWERAPGTVDAETLIRRHASPRKRAVQVGVALLLVVIVAALFHSATTLLSGKQRSSSGVPASATPLSGPQYIAISANVSYGTATVDGKHLSGALPFVFRLRPGGDDVTFSAPPFTPQTCHVVWQQNWLSVSSPCGAGSDSNGVNFSPGGQTVVVTNFLSFDFDASYLPDTLSAQAAALVRQVVVPASGKIVIPAGQYYATGQDASGRIRSRIATAPLIQSAVLQLPEIPDPSANQFYSCGQLICGGPSFDYSAPTQAPPPPGRVWQIFIPMVFRWQIETPDGQMISAHTDDSGRPTGVYTVLRLDDTNTWQLVESDALFAIHNEEQQEFSNSACNDGMNVLQEIENQQGGDFSFSTQNSDNGLSGCELQTFSGNTNDNNTAATGTFIWRFGVLLAADTKTHAAYPQLPLAPPAEIAAVIGG